MSKKYLTIGLMFTLLALVFCEWYCLELFDSETHGDSLFYKKENTIAFIDTGINSELMKEYNVIDSFNAFTKSKNVADYNGHGSAMVSIACGNGYKGIKGLADKSNIIVIKAANKDGIMKQHVFQSALRYIIKKKKTINFVCISFGGRKQNDITEALLKEIFRNDIKIFCAAGDSGTSDVMYPASSEYTYSVGALNFKRNLMSDSNRSKTIDYWLPGENILCIDNNGNIQSWSGTSEATAIATAMAASNQYIFLTKYKKMGITQYDVWEEQ